MARVCEGDAHVELAQYRTTDGSGKPRRDTAVHLGHAAAPRAGTDRRSEEHTSELQSHSDLVCRLLLEKKTAAVKLAALLESRRGRPVVPVFWSASEDHDFAEVRSVPVLDESGRIRTLRYEPAREPAAQ